MIVQLVRQIQGLLIHFVLGVSPLHYAFLVVYYLSCHNEYVYVLCRIVECYHVKWNGVWNGIQEPWVCDFLIAPISSLHLIIQNSPGLGRGVPGLDPALPALPALEAGHELVEAALAAREHGAAGAGVAAVTRALQWGELWSLAVINCWVHFTDVNIPS